MKKTCPLCKTPMARVGDRSSCPVCKGIFYDSIMKQPRCIKCQNFAYYIKSNNEQIFFGHRIELVDGVWQWVGCTVENEGFR